MNGEIRYQLMPFQKQNIRQKKYAKISKLNAERLKIWLLEKYTKNIYQVILKFPLNSADLPKWVKPYSLKAYRNFIILDIDPELTEMASEIARRRKTKVMSSTATVTFYIE